MTPEVLESMRGALTSVQSARGHFVQALNVLGLGGLQVYPRLFGWCAELTVVEQELFLQHNAVLAHMARAQPSSELQAVEAAAPVASTEPAVEPTDLPTPVVAE
jgi:hypothetical protein